MSTSWENLGRSLVTTLKEVKARPYGKDGHAVEKPIPEGIEERYLKVRSKKEKPQILSVTV